MKPILIFILACLPAISLFSQDWAPFPPGDTLIYDRASTPELDLSVWVEEVIETADGEEWKLNPHYRPCDTCDGPHYMGIPILEINKPFPFGGSVKVDSLGKYWINREDGKDILLIPGTGVGGSWVMDSLNMIIGTVESEYSDSIFGEPDVLKKISISTGDSMLISQQHGFIYFPDSLTHGEQLTLIAIPDRLLGGRLLSFWEIYDFQNGDSLFYNVSNGSHSGSHFTELRVTILGRTNQSNSIRFDVELKGRRENSGGATNPWYYSVTGVEILDHSWVFVKDSLHHVNSLPGQLWPNYMTVFQPVSISDLWTETAKLDTTMIGPVLRTDTSLTVSDYYTTGKDLYSIFDSLPPDLLPRVPRFGYDFESRYELGLGQTYFKYWGPEEGITINLVGYIRDQDTVGTIFTEEYLHVDVEDELLAAGISVFPNPSQGPVTIQVSQAALLPSELTIFTLTGKKVYTSRLSQQESIIEVATFPKGIYLMQLQVPDGRTLRSRLAVR